jgi:hypothetical protein
MTSNDSIATELHKAGPARSARLVDSLTDQLNISPQAVRQRLSRARTPVERYPVRLLPKGEAFFYLRDQRNTERFWNNLLRDLRETGAVYGCAIDGLKARGGIVPVDEFAVVSGAPLALKKQVSTGWTAWQLVDLGVMSKAVVDGFGYCFAANREAIFQPLQPSHIKARHLAETVMLDGLRQWAWKNGIGSRDTIVIRGENHPLLVGQFKWDMTGPCYLLPLRRERFTHGFVVADVFADTELDAYQIRYFVRKAQMYQKTSNSGPLFPILMAESFTRDALTEGHKAGLLLTTPGNLFGQAVARALVDLVRTLKRIAGYASADIEALSDLLTKLAEIEGRAGNMRGILFELMVARIAATTWEGRVDIGVRHTHREDGRSAELDVVCERAQEVHVIECKGKIPGGTVSLAEVEDWLRRLPVMRDYVASRDYLRDHWEIYEFWTTGTFERDALEKLQFEKAHRTRRPIDWQDGTTVRKIVASRGLKSIGDALDQHFLRHPLAFTRKSS